MESTTYTAFERLSDILDTLRKECPWDRVQTLQSLRYLTIEEVHELSEAIVSGNTDHLKKELGDLVMHIMFYCKIAEEQGLFTTADVYNAICDKLVDRHPFIYHKDDYHGESWEQLKMRERDRRGVLDGVPDSLPSLVKAVRMQEKVAGMNEKLKIKNEELREDMSEEEFGDYLFALVDWARRHGINADDALCGANYRFKQQIENTTE
ncbi:MAG: nucleoside triphosphate pyrophosphohydrolase [Bacteroidales bacterium]|nr:nucleoside triphosphate pyrophosphohydrolase [Bacteroidales bacterium]